MKFVIISIVANLLQQIKFHGFKAGCFQVYSYSGSLLGSFSTRCDFWVFIILNY